MLAIPRSLLPWLMSKAKHRPILLELWYRTTCKLQKNSQEQLKRRQKRRREPLNWEKNLGGDRESKKVRLILG
jgi:hypothetical protein